MQRLPQHRARHWPETCRSSNLREIWDLTISGNSGDDAKSTHGRRLQSGASERPNLVFREDLYDAVEI
jgi:hypothetical protein